VNIIGVKDVESAQGAIVISAGDLVTPLARDRAGELGIEIRTSASPSATLAVPPAASAVATTVTAEAVNTLYRRGAPVAAPLTAGRSGPARVAVIGAGHVGSIAALHLAATDLFESVTLIDVVDGLAAGVALDLWHSAGLSGFATEIRGSSSLADLSGSDYVIVTAGRARRPGMSRTDLTQANADIVGPIAEQIRTCAPHSVVVVVTNPLEEMTHLAQVRTGFPAERVLGMAGVLDSARFAALIALTGIGRPDEVQAYALGSHGPEMVIPMSQATVRGRPIREMLDAATLSAVTERVRDSGAEVVSLLKSGSAYFAPGRSAAEMVCEMVCSRGRVLACAVAPQGEYGLRDTRVGLPVKLGPGGLEEIVTLELEPGELDQLRRAAKSLSERIQSVA
jgi:malate dehydrogenase